MLGGRDTPGRRPPVGLALASHLPPVCLQEFLDLYAPASESVKMAIMKYLTQGR